MSEGKTFYPKLEKELEKLQKKVCELRKKTAPEIDPAITELEGNVKFLLSDFRGDLNAINKQIQRLSANYDELVAKLEVFKSPPFAIVTFVRFVQMEKLDKQVENSPEAALIAVKDTGGREAYVYFMDDDTDVHTLKYGQQLLIRSNSGSTVSHVLRTLSAVKTEGVVASILEVLQADQGGMRYLVATSETAAPQVVHTIDTVDRSMLKKGERVLIDESQRLILEVLGEKESSESYLVGEVPSVTFDDIGGLTKVKREVKQLLINPILFPKVKRRIGRPAPRGCVLKGAPGLGKTMIAKAIFNLFSQMSRAKLAASGQSVDLAPNRNFFHIKGSELLTKWVGVPEERFRAVFAEMRKRATPENPALLFIDEAEAYLATRGSGISSDTEKNSVPAFCTEVDGLESVSNIIVIIATNRPDLIDGAVLRRLDRTFEVTRPDREGSTQIFEKFLAAEWGQIHPKYNVPVYEPYDRFGKPKTDASGKQIRLQFDENPVEARKYLIEKAVARIFDVNDDRNLVADITYDGGAKQVIRFKDLVSGSRIERIVNHAKEIAEQRFNECLEKKGLLLKAEDFADASNEVLEKEGLEPLGVQLEDLYESIEEIFGEISVANSDRGFRGWLLIEGFAQGRDIQSLTFAKRPNASN